MSEDKPAGSKSIRIPSELYDAVASISSKHGEMTKFISDAVKEALKDKGNEINMCKFCILSQKCEMKTMIGRTYCLYHVSPFSSMICKNCINWDKTGRKCILIKDYGYGYRPNENDRCILSAFDPLSFQKGLEGREKERRDKTRQYLTTFKQIFRNDEGSTDLDSQENVFIEENDMIDDASILDRLSKELDDIDEPEVKRV